MEGCIGAAGTALSGRRPDGPAMPVTSPGFAACRPAVSGSRCGQLPGPRSRRPASAACPNNRPTVVSPTRIRMAPNDLRAREFQQRTDVVAICGPKSGDTSSARFADVGQIPPAPCKRFVAEPRRHQISHQARSSTITVGKRVDCNKPVMQTHGNLVGRECLVFNPKTNVVGRRFEFEGDPHRLDTDVPLGSTKLAGPGPDVTEEALVKLPEEFLREQVASANVPGPYRARSDVRLLRLVQVSPIGDPGLEQTFVRFWLERGCIRRLIEEIAQASSHRSRSRR